MTIEPDQPARGRHPIAGGGEPFNALCCNCGAVWTVGYLPMPMIMFSAVLRDARCPHCGVDSSKHRFTELQPSLPNDERRDPFA